MVFKVKILEAKYKAYLEFPRGSGAAKQKTFRGGVWIFSGTAQSTQELICLRLSPWVARGKLTNIMADA